jgi:hypothetical protein
MSRSKSSGPRASDRVSPTRHRCSPKDVEIRLDETVLTSESSIDGLLVDWLVPVLADNWLSEQTLQPNTTSSDNKEQI